MTACLTTVQYQSPIGLITLVSDGDSLAGLRFIKQEGTEPRVPTLAQNLPIFSETFRWLDLYFNGTKPDFTPPINPKGSVFQQKVWRELLTIPYGQTTTYGAIANRINCRSAQAVGQAIHSNPIAIIIPCHRVIGSNGSLMGYAAGLEIKQQLLKLETLNNFLSPIGFPDVKESDDTYDNVVEPFCGPHTGDGGVFCH